MRIARRPPCIGKDGAHLKDLRPAAEARSGRRHIKHRRIMSGIEFRSIRIDTSSGDHEGRLVLVVGVEKMTERSGAEVKQPG